MGVVALRPATSKDGALCIPRLGRRCRSIGNTLARSTRVFVRVKLGRTRTMGPRMLRVNFNAKLGTFLALLRTRGDRETVRFADVRQFPLSRSVMHRLTCPRAVTPRRYRGFCTLRATP